MKKIENGNIENEKSTTQIEFSLENIKKGLFDGKKGGKTSNWNMFASKRLLKESGQILSEDATKVMEDIPYKWYYYNRKSDNNTGNIIVGLHKKDVQGWIYVVINSDTGSYKEFNKLVDAKENIELV